MGVVIDTCVWVDVERGRLKPISVAEAIGDVPVYLTPVVLAELQYGVERATSPTQRQLRLSALARLRRKPCLVVDQTTGEICGRLAAELDTQGRSAAHRAHDLWIAASALQHHFRVLTRNAADFADIPGLVLVVI